MHPMLEYITKFFGSKWIQEKWGKYLATRTAESPTEFTVESIIEEIELHPVLYLAADPQDIKRGEFNFGKVSNDSGNYSILLLLGRDLKLLEREIEARGSKIKNSLKRNVEFDSTRFCLLIATAYKLLGFNIEFLPEKENKTPDLLVSNGSYQFVVECKQRNQRQADKDRYEMFVKIVSAIRPSIISKNLTDLSIEIKINLNRNDLFEKINKTIIKSLSTSNYNPVKDAAFSVKFAKAHLRAHYGQFVNNPSNMNKVVYFTRAENAFLFTDPRKQNMIHMNKHYSEDLLPSNLYDLIHDANKKEKNGHKLILHYDFGMSDSGWSDIVANKIYNEVTENRSTYNEIDLFVFSQTIPKNISQQVIIKPDFKTIGSKTRLGNIPFDLIVGQQGETGMDTYLDDLRNYT